MELTACWLPKFSSVTKVTWSLSQALEPGVPPPWDQPLGCKGPALTARVDREARAPEKLDLQGWGLRGGAHFKAWTLVCLLFTHTRSDSGGEGLGLWAR